MLSDDAVEDGQSNKNNIIYLQSSSNISDAEIEAQPLWEYPCKSRGEPVKMLAVIYNRLEPTYAIDGVVEVL